MARRVCIIGCGTIPFTRQTDIPLESVLLHSVKNLFESSRCTVRDVDAVFVANAAGGYHNDQYPAASACDGSSAKMYKNDMSGGDNDNNNNNDDDDDDNNNVHPDTNSNLHINAKKGSGYMASVLAEIAGIKPRAAHTIESLCSSGSNAIVSGYAYVASNLAEVALVSGAEIADTQGRVLWWDDSRGEFKHPTFWASIMTRMYKRQHDVSGDDLAVIPARAHENARANPDALQQGRHTSTVQDVIDSPHVTGDLRVLDCSRPCTGGASVLLASEDVASKYTDSPVWITGIGQKTMSAGFAKTENPSRIESAHAACGDAMRMAARYNDINYSKNTKSFDIDSIDVAEIHDAFSVCEPMIFEAMGIAQKGRGVHTSRHLYETKSRMINPRGGLIGSGHPLGATGVAQAAEIARQLWLEADGRQADSPDVGLVHNMAAAGTSSTVLVMQR